MIDNTPIKKKNARVISRDPNKTATYEAICLLHVKEKYGCNPTTRESKQQYEMHIPECPTGHHCLEVLQAFGA